MVSQHIHLVPQETAGYLWAHIFFWYVFPILAIIIMVGGIWLFRSLAGTIGSIAVGLFIIAASIGIYVGANWPLQSAYHTYTPTTITVAQIGNRFLSDGNGGTNQRYVFLDKDGVPYAVDDTRASLVKVGETVTLLCVKEWEQNGVPGFACNWGEVGPNG